MIPLLALESLLAAARKATPGPWRAVPAGILTHHPDAAAFGWIEYHGEASPTHISATNAAHIASYDPATIGEILEELIAFKKSPLGPHGESGCAGKEKL